MWTGIFIGISIATIGYVIAEIALDYSVGDWVKDHTLAQFKRFESFEHAKAANLKAKAVRLEQKAEAIKAKIEADIRKAEFWKQRK
jgi:hypothetical protein